MNDGLFAGNFFFCFLIVRTIATRYGLIPVGSDLGVTTIYARTFSE